MSLVTLHINKPYYNVEPQAKVMLIDEARDCYYESNNEGFYALRRRPGYSVFSSLASGGAGQGLFWSDRFGAVFAVANGKLYRVESDGTATELTGVPSISTGTNVVFAEAQTLALTPFIYIAHGGYLLYTDGATKIQPSDPNLPTQAKFVASLNNRIWADNGGQDFLITGTNPATGLLDPFYWSMVNNPWRAAQKADLLLAMIAAWNKMFLWGSQTIEQWQEDGENPISPLVGATSEFGIEAPHTILQANNTMHALGVLDGKRAFVNLRSGNPYILSTAIDRELHDMGDISDATSSLLFVGGLNALLLNFPAQNRTWVLDLKEEIWTKWGDWNEQIGKYDKFPIVKSCFAKAWNKYLFQGTDGNIYEFSRNTYQDRGDEIRTLIRTGWINHDTDRRKRSARLYIKLKAYHATPATLLMRWRNDGRPEWSNYVELKLGSESQQTQFIELTRMGVYRSRQYEFLMTDNADMALMGMQEDIMELRN